MNSTRTPRYLFSLMIGCCLIFLLAACGSQSSPSATGSKTPTSGTVTSGKTPTQPSCPAAGTARAAVITPLALGNHPTLVYIINEGPFGTPNFGVLKGYDVTTGRKVDIVKLAKTSISEAQISADGQWILFVATVATEPRLELVRMDGQGLQTLYCDSAGKGLGNVEWSTDQKLVVFGGGGEFGGVSLLNLQTGRVQLEVDAFLTILTWLDNTRVYVTPHGADVPSDELDILDTSRVSHQQRSDLTKVFQGASSPSKYPCFDADRSYTGSTLFVSQCSASFSDQGSGPGFVRGPSSIGVQPVGGGTLRTIFTSATLAIRTVRAISNRTLLLTVKNYNEKGNIDTRQNGLWELNTDGTGLRHLSATGNWNEFTQYPWSNVSRNGELYAFQVSNLDAQDNYSYALEYGSLSGATPTTFAANSGGLLAIVGWTTL